MKRPPETCPNCGAEVPRNARACPECGADDKTGWNDRAAAQNLGLPDDEFDYDTFVREEFGEAGSPKRTSRWKPRGLRWLWWLVAIAIATTFLLLSVPGILGF